MLFESHIGRLGLQVSGWGLKGGAQPPKIAARDIYMLSQQTLTDDEQRRDVL